MPNYFTERETTPDEKAITEEREDMLHRICNLEREINVLRSNEKILTDVIVRLAMKIVGVD